MINESSCMRTQTHDNPIKRAMEETEEEAEDKVVDHIGEEEVVAETVVLGTNQSEMNPK